MSAARYPFALAAAGGYCSPPGGKNGPACTRLLKCSAAPIGREVVPDSRRSFLLPRARARGGDGAHPRRDGTRSWPTLALTSEARYPFCPLAWASITFHSALCSSRSIAWGPRGLTGIFTPQRHRQRVPQLSVSRALGAPLLLGGAGGWRRPAPAGRGRRPRGCRGGPTRWRNFAERLGGRGDRRRVSRCPRSADPEFWRPGIAEYRRHPVCRPES